MHCNGQDQSPCSCIHSVQGRPCSRHFFRDTTRLASSHRVIGYLALPRSFLRSCPQRGGNQTSGWSCPAGREGNQCPEAIKRTEPPWNWENSRMGVLLLSYSVMQLTLSLWLRFPTGLWNEYDGGWTMLIWLLFQPHLRGQPTKLSKARYPRRLREFRRWPPTATLTKQTQ